MFRVALVVELESVVLLDVAWVSSSLKLVVISVLTLAENPRNPPPAEAPTEMSRLVAVTGKLHIPIRIFFKRATLFVIGLP
jgi:hypothetical protein